MMRKRISDESRSVLRMTNEMKNDFDRESGTCTIVTAGALYLDIDAFACCIAMKELLELQGEQAIAYSPAAFNYSICDSFSEPGQMITRLPQMESSCRRQYVVVDVSDPDYIQQSVPLEAVVRIYDHHPGYAEYWKSRIGENAVIEFVGAAASLVYREWKKAGLEGRMRSATAKLLAAAILDNTLNLQSANTTALDRQIFAELCSAFGIGEAWTEAYFEQVQNRVEADLERALLYDIKRIRNTAVLPRQIAQLSVWNADRILEKIQTIRACLNKSDCSWMVNLIDIHRNCSYFICDDEHFQRRIERAFGVRFDLGIAKSDQAYLRKEMIGFVMR